MVVDLGPALSEVAEGTLVALDGKLGKAWFAPGPDRVAQLEAQRDAWRGAQQAMAAASACPARTRNGRRVEVMANIAGPGNLRRALENGAEGVGLLRTEFLYLGHAVAPSEEEQCTAYRAMAAALGPRPLVIRTLDIGGDKPLPYLKMPPEVNPFLGWRGLRIGLEQPALLRTQLQAILRASHGQRLRIMFPFVSTLDEIRAAKSILAEAKAGLRTTQIPFDEAIEVGLMVEVPSAVVLAGRFAAEVQFFSLGTNDLGQYVMAADRTNPRVSALADPLQPAVLRMMRQASEAAHRAGIRVALCGELAADPLAVPLLVGMGLDELSMSPPAIPAAKWAIAQVSDTEAELALAEVLTLDSAEAVRQHLAQRFPLLHSLA
jgi:phosphoenolpyruvate-protein phosphotransferase